MGPKDIAAEAEMSDAAVRQMLGRMVKAGELVKAVRGRYALPDADKECDDRESRGECHNGHNVTDRVDIAVRLEDSQRPAPAAPGEGPAEVPDLASVTMSVQQSSLCDVVTDVTEACDATDGKEIDPLEIPPFLDRRGRKPVDRN